MNTVFGKVRHVHFVGIGGIGMSGIAEVLHAMGFTVSGCDVGRNANVERLERLGVRVELGHDASHLDGVDAVVYSSALKPSHPELAWARDNYIPVIKRGEMLAELMRLKFAVAVAGSHGKTSTTSMVSEILDRAGLDPTIIIGGRLNTTDANAAFGASKFMVAEADESDRSFLMLYPSVAVVTNIDFEHTDTYADLDDVKGAFAEFVNRVPFYGAAVVCIDDDHVADLIPHIDKRFITYGVKARADIHGTNVERKGFATSFDVEAFGEKLGTVDLQLPGAHNVLNALAAIGVSIELGIPFNIIKEGLEAFTGVQRRLSVRYRSDDVVVIDDYGHHPTEINATLKALRQAFSDWKIVAIFQPHRYTRTQSLMKDFAKCFFDADELFVTDIYAASEDPITGVDAHALVSAIKSHGFKDVAYLPSFDDFNARIDEYRGEKTVLLTLGAGSVTRQSFAMADILGGNA